MAEHRLLATGTDDDTVVDLDLRDEQGLLAGVRAEYDVEGVRALLAAINLRPTCKPAPEATDAVVTDLAVYRATGSCELARIFTDRR